MVTATLTDDLADTRLTLEFLEAHGYFDMPIQVSAASSFVCHPCGQPITLLSQQTGQTRPDLVHVHVQADAVKCGTCTACALQQAAAELRVGVTTLKKVCRVNNIGRWPFRKRSSLNRLIEKTREYFAGDEQQCAEALAQLEAQRSMLRVGTQPGHGECIDAYIGVHCWLESSSALALVTPNAKSGLPFTLRAGAAGRGHSSKRQALPPVHLQAGL
jgi:hypothetical protein